LSEHLTQEQIEGYGRRALSATELISASDHLGVCESCRRQVEQAMDGDAAFFSMASDTLGAAAEARSVSFIPAHLTFERTADYVDGELEGEELQAIKDHLTGCVMCAAAVNDLRAFRNQVATDLRREYQPATVRSVGQSGWRRFGAAISALAPRSTALVFGSALAALVLVVAGWLIWQATSQNDKKPNMTNNSPSPTVTPIVSPTRPEEGAGENLLAQLNDGGGRVTLDREGKLSGVDYLPPSHQQMVKEALTNRRFEKSPLLAGLPRPGSLVIRGSDNQSDKFSVTEPVGKVALSDRPAFRWTRLEGAASYVVEIYDDTFTLVSSSAPLTGNTWTPIQPLKRGAVFSWQVKATKDGQEFITPRPPAPQAKFRILDQVRANELTRSQRDYASSHLTLALLYADAGLLDEAERELRALRKANPDSDIARRLLSDVRTMRR
jgi:anti-sigma factor RsiW